MKRDLHLTANVIYVFPSRWRVFDPTYNQDCGANGHAKCEIDIADVIPVDVQENTIVILSLLPKM